MAKEKKKNIFQQIGQLFKDVRQELRRVVWPTKDKLKSVSAVVLVAIVFFAIFLSIINLGGHWLLEKSGFYDQAEQTTTAATAATAATTAEPQTPADETSPDDPQSPAEETSPDDPQSPAEAAGEIVDDGISSPEDIEVPESPADVNDDAAPSGVVVDEEASNG